MRYFTSKWWKDGQRLNRSADREAATAPFRAYSEHLNAIRDQLPAKLVQMTEFGPLHDGQLRQFKFDGSAETLDFIIDGDDGTGGFREYALNYSEVSSFVVFGQTDSRSCDPADFGTWGYDELDSLPTGEFEHHVLFSSGVELAIRGRRFDASWTDGGGNIPSTPAGHSLN